MTRDLLHGIVQDAAKAECCTIDQHPSCCRKLLRRRGLNGLPGTSPLLYMPGLHRASAPCCSHVPSAAGAYIADADSRCGTACKDDLHHELPCQPPNVRVVRLLHHSASTTLCFSCRPGGPAGLSLMSHNKHRLARHQGGPCQVEQWALHT